MRHLQCRSLALLVVGMVGCDKGAPAKRPAATPPAAAGSDASVATADAAPAADDGASAITCGEAVAAWTTLPTIERTETAHPEDVAASTARALGLLVDEGAFAHCSDEQLAPLLAVSMTRLENYDIVSNSLGVHGAAVTVRHVATRILSNLSGQTFGTLSIISESPDCQFVEGSDETTVTKWRAWWERAQKDPIAVVAAARAGKAVPFVFEGQLGARLAREDKLREAARLECQRNRRPSKVKMSKECMENPLAKGCS